MRNRLGININIVAFALIILAVYYFMQAKESQDDVQQMQQLVIDTKGISSEQPKRKIIGCSSFESTEKLVGVTRL